MTRRLDKSWTIYRSIENDEHDRCVDLILRPDRSHGFEEFRRDEDGWVPVHHYSGLSFATESEALQAAAKVVPWLRAVS
ncbi:hypothetical protein BoBH3_11420 [Bosea sp. BH3]|nr:hypothetical protein [Bosea sp. BH3]